MTMSDSETWHDAHEDMASLLSKINTVEADVYAVQDRLDNLEERMARLEVTQTPPPPRASTDPPSSRHQPPKEPHEEEIPFGWRPSAHSGHNYKPPRRAWKPNDRVFITRCDQYYMRRGTIVGPRKNRWPFWDIQLDPAEPGGTPTDIYKTDTGFRLIKAKRSSQAGNKNNKSYNSKTTSDGRYW